MSFIVNAVHSVGNAIGSAANAVGNAVGGAVNSIGKAANSVANTVANSISDAVTKAGNAVAQVSADVVHQFGPQLLAAGLQALGVPAPVTTALEGALGITPSTGSGILGTITSTLNSLSANPSQAVNDLGNAVLQTISQLTGSTQTQLNNVVSGITNLVGNSFQPLTKLADQFASQAAVTLQAADHQVQGNTVIAKEIFAPAMATSIQDPLTKINSTMDAYTKPPSTQLTDPKEINLDTNMGRPQIFKDVQDLITNAQKEGGLIPALIAAGWNIAKIVSVAPIFLKGALEEAEQYVNTAAQGLRLDANSATNAYMKGIISKDDWYKEMLSHGISNQRSDTLLELLTPFLAASDAIKAWQLGVITEDMLNTELTKQGYETSHIQTLKEIAAYTPNASDALSFYYRGLIDETALEEILKANGYATQDIKIAKDSSLSPISPQGYVNVDDRIRARDKGFMPVTYIQNATDTIREVYKQNRLDPKQADIDFLAHWKDLPPNDWITAYFRGFINEEQMRLALDAQSIPQEAVDLLLQLQRPQLSIRYLTELLQTGGLTEKETTDYLRTQGYDDSTIALILKYIDARIYGRIAQTHDSMLQLSIGQLEQMYNDGVIDSDQYKEGLIHHAYTPEAADLLVHLKTTQIELSHRKEVATDIIDEFKLGFIDMDKAVSMLYDKGFSDGEVNKYQSQMTRAKMANSKLPSEAQLASLFKKGLISEGLYLKQLQALGYSTLWSALIYEETTGKVISDAATQTTIREVTGIDIEGNTAPKANSEYLSKQSGPEKAIGNTTPEAQR